MRLMKIGVPLAFLVAGCAEPPPPPSVAEFLQSESLLSTTLIRCNAERDRLKDDPECMNARKAAARISAREEEEERQRAAAAFERKRETARQRVERREQAERLAEEAEIERRRAELLGGTVYPAGEGGDPAVGIDDLPVDGVVAESPVAADGAVAGLPLDEAPAAPSDAGLVEAPAAIEAMPGESMPAAAPQALPGAMPESAEGAVEELIAPEPEAAVSEEMAPIAEPGGDTAG